MPLKTKRKYYFIINIFLLILLILVLNGNNVYSKSHNKKLFVDKIVFSGNKIFDDQTLNELISSNFGQEHTLDDLQELAKRIQEYYQNRGYFLARVIIPQQEIKKGTVKFLVFEGELGKIIIKGNKHYKEKYIRRALSPLKSGNPIKKNVLKKSLLALNNTSGIRVSSVLKAGSEKGVTDIYIKVKELNRKDFSLSTEYDFEAEGYDISTNFDFLNVSGSGDKLGLNISKTKDDSDVISGRISYMRPFGTMDKKLKLYYKANHSGANENFSELNIKTSGNTWGIGGSYSAILTPEKSLKCEAWYEGEKSKQTMLGVKTSLDIIRKIRFGLNYKNRNNTGQTLVSLNIHKGLGEILGGMPDDSTLSSRSYAYADNDFTKININFNNLYSVNKGLFFTTYLAGQYAFDSLVSEEQWEIGGLDSVRGYPESLYLGDDGFTFNLEAHKYMELFQKDSQLVFFYDHGQINIHKPTFTQDKKKKISSLGIGLRTSINQNLNLSLDWGFPLEKDYENTLYFQLDYNFKI